MAPGPYPKTSVLPFDGRPAPTSEGNAQAPSSAERLAKLEQYAKTVDQNMLVIGRTLEEFSTALQRLDRMVRALGKTAGFRFGEGWFPLLEEKPPLKKSYDDSATYR